MKCSISYAKITIFAIYLTYRGDFVMYGLHVVSLNALFVVQMKVKTLICVKILRRQRK